MSVAEEIRQILAGWTGPATYPDVVVDDDGDDAAIVSSDPGGHHFGKTMLGQEVKPVLEAAGFDVALAGSLRQIPGHFPGAATGRRDTSTSRAYDQRDVQFPRLRVTRKA